MVEELDDRITQATANLTSHRIEGIARMSGQNFSCPLISHVEGNLWQGGTPADVGGLPPFFEFVVNLYPWESYAVHSKTVQLTARLYDEGVMPHLPTLFALADAVSAFAKAGPTLVHCQAGLNRSALVTAIALIREGRTPEQAIELLRRRSPAVLCNQTFENFLLGIHR